MESESPTPDLHDPRDRRLPHMAPPCGLVLFGITGDLARKKLLPAIYDLTNRGLLSPAFALTGFARRDWDREDFEEFVRSSIENYSRTDFNERTWQQLASGLRFVSGSFDDPDAYKRLAETVAELDQSRGTGGNHAFYLSIPPRWFPVVCQNLADNGLNQREGNAWRRVIIEKPFGQDLASARELSDVVGKAFDESDVFRIDHYLGKETVQNILAIRFANTMFEPLWKANYVDHVQITMAEEIGIGTRAGYYDGIGAARDVIQNHLLQLLALTAMEEPVRFTPESLRAEKEKILSALRLPEDLASTTAHGQYAAGWQGGAEVKGFLDEDGIPAESHTETYAALKLFVDTRRWAGVPFYLRTGKRLGKRVTEIAVVFKRAAHVPFENSDVAESGQNVLVIRVQPDEGMTIKFGAKVPGTEMQVRDVTMDFNYGHAFTEDSPEAYERLILDALVGSAPLFPHQREVELSWQILDPVLRYWAERSAPEPYKPGSWGPDSAHDMLARDGRTWRIP
ncbi:glucose-6-phosphate dehydrogenase [Actinobaculum sp. 313]|uniref:glucose-6-phosphate dehydrogenase n=1 Tax=Actinobaculum sp. 313 TaxID=2495645 RepID=UPI000D5263BE|nr:glucose-6-phosphate dehydrogenase [Actinobaculum sp. 313]AWE41898.1 glucose-6-phosphate dehydrogenase [Actinobaculum sp. 313]